MLIPDSKEYTQEFFKLLPIAEQLSVELFSEVNPNEGNAKRMNMNGKITHLLIKLNHE